MRIIIYMLITCHLLINSMWASAHPPEAGETDHATPHVHLDMHHDDHDDFDTEEELQQHLQEHDDHAHVHLVLLTNNADTIPSIQHRAPQEAGTGNNYLSLAHRPPVPPPTR